MVKEKKERKFNKLRKKWKFWREFKKFFLRRKKKVIFYRISDFFKERLILLHQMKAIYGKGLKNLNYKKNHMKRFYGCQFFNLIIYLELRLSVLVQRMYLAKDFLDAKQGILLKEIQVNGVSCSKNYLVCVGDIIKKEIKAVENKKRYKLLKSWRRWSWKKWRWKMKQISMYQQSFYWCTKKSYCLNYIEMNYKIGAGILLKIPSIGEILLKNNRRLLSENLLRKIYNVY